MRFLIGIIIGAILTLFSATAVDAPTHPAFDQVRNQFAGVWDDLIDTTSDSLFPATEALVDTDTPETPETPENKKLTADPERPADRPVAALSAPEPLPPSPPADAITATAANSKEPVAGDLTVPPDVAATQPDPEGVPSPYETNSWQPQIYLEQSTPGVLAEPSPAAVWEPFHSQMSAEGFAKRLSRELQHSFRVERQGAGAYQVVFDVNSQGERDLLLAQIAEITGQ